jgi:hypothetical protein
MSQDFDTPPIRDPITQKGDIPGDIWVDWVSTLIDNLRTYLTSQGSFLPPLTSAQIAAITAPTNGQMIFNSTTGMPQVYYGGTWNNF